MLWARNNVQVQAVNTLVQHTRYGDALQHEFIWLERDEKNEEKKKNKQKLNKQEKKNVRSPLGFKLKQPVPWFALAKRAESLDACSWGNEIEPVDSR